MTREEWLRDTQIRKEIRDAKVIICKLSSARIAYVENSWLEYVYDKYTSTYSIEEYEEQLINLCWNEVSPRTKTMTIKYMNYNEDGTYTQHYLPTKHKR